MELTPELVALRDKLRRVLTMYYPRHQNTRDNNPWEVMHAIIAYGVDTQLFKDGPGGEKVNAIGWMCYNCPCAGEQMLLVNRGQIEARRGVGVQGHFGQFLAILAQSHVKPDYPMLVSGKNFTLQDLIEHEKANLHRRRRADLQAHRADALPRFRRHLEDAATARTGRSSGWSREELKQPIRGAACGGTHRLMGFSYCGQQAAPARQADRRRVSPGPDLHPGLSPLHVQPAEPRRQLQHRVVRPQRQQPGRRPPAEDQRPHPGVDQLLAVRRRSSRDPRMIKAVDYVATILEKNDRHTWEIGPLGHGLHALAIYDDRVFKDGEALAAGHAGRSAATRDAAGARSPAAQRRHDRLTVRGSRRVIAARPHGLGGAHCSSQCAGLSRHVAATRSPCDLALLLAGKILTIGWPSRAAARLVRPMLQCPWVRGIRTLLPGQPGSHSYSRRFSYRKLAPAVKTYRFTEQFRDGVRRRRDVVARPSTPTRCWCCSKGRPTGSG